MIISKNVFIVSKRISIFTSACKKRTYEKRLFFNIILEAVFHEIQTMFALFVFWVLNFDARIFCLFAYGFFIPLFGKRLGIAFQNFNSIFL